MQRALGNYARGTCQARTPAFFRRPSALWRALSLAAAELAGGRSDAVRGVRRPRRVGATLLGMDRKDGADACAVRFFAAGRAHRIANVSESQVHGSHNGVGWLPRRRCIFGGFRACGRARGQVWTVAPSFCPERPQCDKNDGVVIAVAIVANPIVKIRTVSAEGPDMGLFRRF